MRLRPLSHASSAFFDLNNRSGSGKLSAFIFTIVQVHHTQPLLLNRPMASAEQINFHFTFEDLSTVEEIAKVLFDQRLQDEMGSRLVTPGATSTSSDIVLVALHTILWVVTSVVRLYCHLSRPKSTKWARRVMHAA